MDSFSVERTRRYERFSMKRFAAPAFWVCLALMLTGMTCRLLWLASGTETGLQSLQQQWWDATIGLVVGSSTPIHSREPVEQAEFWLREVDQVMHVHPRSARLAVGAALVLDSPSTGFMSKYLRKFNKIPGIASFPEMDEEGIERAEEAFETRCKERCLDLAASATTLDSSNVEWWRLRALLLWRYSVHSYDDSPRNPNWVEILEECARHDPDNALYDYLAAHFYWDSSAEMDFSGPNKRLLVKDTERFKRGIDCFERGQSKSSFEVGDTGFTTVAEFLRNTKSPLTEHEQIVNSRGIHLRRSILLHRVWDWQGLRADEVSVRRITW